MDVLVAGGTGFIGRALVHMLLEQGHHVTILSRSPKKSSSQSIDWLQWDGLQLNTDRYFDVIINLCGFSIAAARWSDGVKKKIFDSRLQPTEALVNYIASRKEEKKPRLLNASGIGVYPSSHIPQWEEVACVAPKQLLTNELGKQWEACARKAENSGAVVVCMRFGVVLGTDGGMMSRLLPAYAKGLGAIMGDKKSYLSWIHINDLCRAILHVMELERPRALYNFTSPKPCQNIELADALSQAFNRRRFLRVPPFFVKLLFGEMGEELLLVNQRVLPKYLQQAGFQFKFSDIRNAVQDIVSH